MSDPARRAVACRHWRWMPGMLVRYGDGQVWYRLADGDGYGLPFRHVPPDPRDAWPDLTDPATLGCLLALVRELRPYACVEYCGGYWRVVDPQDERWDTDRGFGPWATEAEALVAALEAAP